MKNIEINTKAVKKLFAAGLLSLTMAGCAGNNEPTKQETPKGDKTEEVKKVDDETGFEYVKMTEEETKTLKSGDFIKSEDGKTIKVPDQELLESLGYDFEYEVKQYYGPKGEKLDYYETLFCYGDSQLKRMASPYEFEENGKTMEVKFTIEGVHVISIAEVQKKDDKFIKTIKRFEGYYFETPLINSDNYEKLQKLELNPIAYVYTK